MRMKRKNGMKSLAAGALLLVCCWACGPHQARMHEIAMDKESILKNGEPYTGEVWSDDGKSFCLTTRNGELTRFVMYHLNGREAVCIDNLDDEMTVYDEGGETISIDSFATQYKELAGTLHELFPEDSAETDIEPAGTENP